MDYEEPLSTVESFSNVHNGFEIHQLRPSFQQQEYKVYQRREKRRNVLLDPNKDIQEKISTRKNKLRRGSSHKFEDLVSVLLLLIIWMKENEKSFPKFYYLYMLGDRYGWAITMALTGNTELLHFSLELCHMITTQLIPRARYPGTWKEIIPFDLFMWFKYIYLNRHCIPPSLAKKPFYSILSHFRAQPISTTLKAIEKAKKTRSCQNNVKEYTMKERSKDDLINFQGKIIKTRDLIFPDNMCIEGFSFVEPPSDIKQIPDGESFCIRDAADPSIIIGGRITNAVPEAIRGLLKKLMLQVLKVKPNISRSILRKAFCSHMSAYGATKNCESGSAGVINFFVSKLSSRCTLANKEDRDRIDTLMYKYGFTLIQELIILVYLEYYPEGILHFLEMSSTGEGSPYIPLDITKESELKYGPLMWSLYVTMNYVNKMHIDRRDRSEFTLAIVSNTNQSTKGGEFYFLSHGVSFKQCQGDLYYFRGKKLHGTSFREIPDEHLLVAALVINPSIANIVNEDYTVLEEDM